MTGRGDECCAGHAPFGLKRTVSLSFRKLLSGFPSTSVGDLLMTSPSSRSEMKRTRKTDRSVALHSPADVGRAGSSASVLGSAMLVASFV